MSGCSCHDRRSRSCLGLVAAGLALAGRCGAQVISGESLQDDSTNLFSMTVKVVDAVSGKALEQSTVLLPSMAPPPGRKSMNEWRFVTDERGVTTVRVPAGAVGGNSFGLVVSNVSYPVRQVAWNAQGGTVRGALPEEYTFRLEHGVSIGGYARDERGQALAGLKVVPWGNGAGAYNYNPSAAMEYSSLNRDDNLGVATDAQGFWIYTNFPPDIATFSIDVIRADGSRSVFVSSSTGPQFFLEPGEPIEVERLRATNAVLVIKDGVNIRGLVVDESGRPIPNAVVRERTGGARNMPIEQVTNDLQGRFVFPHRTGSQYLITAEADGHALASTIATVTPEREELKVVLPTARPLRLRGLGENNEPMAGAEVSLTEYRNRGHLMAWRGMTDAEGRVVWTNAPRQSISLTIGAANFPMRMARLAPTAEEQVVRLRKEWAKSIAVRLHALDAGTRQPVARFAVWRDLQPYNDFKESSWVGTNGELQTELSQADFREGRAFGYRFQIRVEGYLPWTSEMSYFDEGDFEATASLRKTKTSAGVVLLPDGQPAGDAKVLWVSGQGSIFMNSPDNQYPGSGVITIQGGKDGSFKFDGAEDDQRMVVIHRDGFASVTLEELRRTGRISLQPWARLAGVLRVGGKPLARERVSIKSPVSWAALDSHHLGFSATTDDAGRFVFTNLPPGNYVLYRTPHLIMGISTTESHRMVFDLAAGESKQVEYGCGGRTVVGRVEAGGEVDWKNDPHLISVKIPAAPAAPNYYAYADPKEFEKARRAHGKSKAVLDYERRRQQFQLVFDRDGNFKVDDVPPGQYELNIRVTKPNKNPRAQRFEVREEGLGSVKREITIPAGPPGEEFDLGVMEMEVKESLAGRSGPLDFTAEPLDGRLFNLVSLRGRPTVLVFWAKWAPGSATKLEELRATVAKMEAKDRPALVTVNLDSNAEDAREELKSLGNDWIQVRLTGAGLFEVTEQLKVDTLPTVLLLDAQGRVMGRDMNGKRLASIVKKLVANKR